MLSLYAGLAFAATLILVVEGWPRAWAALAVIPLAIGVVAGRGAIRAARQARDAWIQSED